MIDFQAAERQRLEEPASEIGLEPLCAVVSEFKFHYNEGIIFIHAYRNLLVTDKQQSSLL